MKTIIAATVATLMAGTAAMADTLVVTANIQGDVEVYTSTGPTSCFQHEKEFKESFVDTWEIFDRITLRDENGSVVGWTYMTPLEAAEAGIMLTFTCIKS